jgi:membrane-bound lytic murein transglycosylase D
MSDSSRIQKTKTFADTIKTAVLAPVTVLPSYLAIYKNRLDSIQKDVQLDYNEYVQTYIDLYTRHKDEMGHVLGLAQYYFPIYEKAFKEAGIPAEIEYLSIVESKLDPMAVSRVGAMGPWQFMPATAKLYGLAMDEYVDERRDPIQASYAAAAYLKDAYMEFGDWLLAIASYNCGKSNVERAIQKANALDFWSIRQYLPAETRNYVPAYIAANYVMNYAGKHDISPLEGSFNMNTDTVMVDRFVTLSSVASVLNTSMHEIQLLNPSYRKMVVNGSVTVPRRLVIPKTSAANYPALYDVLNGNTAALPVTKISTLIDVRPEYHKVKKGESLTEIADQYGVDIQDLRDWNNLRGNKAATGTKLWLNDAHEGATIDNAVKSETKLVTYKVKQGDTLGMIAEKFDGSVEKIKSLNGLKKATIQPGMVLKISRG